MTKIEHRPDKPTTAHIRVRRIFGGETTNYFLLLGTTIFLVAFGLVMVLSSSSIESHVENDSFFASFQRQGLYAFVGVPLMLVAARMPTGFWRRMARPAILIGIGLQLLVPVLGYSYGGNKNWISLGGFNAQPSELVKLALIVWIAHVLTRPGALGDDWKRDLAPIGIATVVAVGLVLVGNDLGTAVIMLMIVFGALFFAGIRLKIIVLSGIVVSALGLIFAFSSLSRSDRINVWLNGCAGAEDYLGDCWQQTHGTWALAAGGVFGAGLGNSKAKWSWVPEADNDYIFAIIGEELGLIGAIVVLALFIVLAASFIRIIRGSADPFVRIVTSGVMVWIIGQAFVNIAVVLGLLPVLGVPLPLISAGGSALISTLLAIGVVLSFAREPSVERQLRVPSPEDRSQRAASLRTQARG